MTRTIYRLSIQVEEVPVETVEPGNELAIVPDEGPARPVLYLNTDLHSREGLYSAITGARETIDDELLHRPGGDAHTDKGDDDL